MRKQESRCEYAKTKQQPLRLSFVGPANPLVCIHHGLKTQTWHRVSLEWSRAEGRQVEVEGPEGGSLGALPTRSEAQQNFPWGTRMKLGSVWKNLLEGGKRIHLLITYCKGSSEFFLKTYLRLVWDCFFSLTHQEYKATPAAYASKFVSKENVQKLH